VSIPLFILLGVLAIQPAPATVAPPPADATARIEAALGPNATSTLIEDERLILAVSIEGLTVEDADFDLRVAEHVASLAFDVLPPDAWDGVLVLDERNFNRFAGNALGPGARGGFHAVGGFYDRDNRRLITNRLGPNLRHELVHLFHERRQRAQDVRDPVWAAEGLASLAESVSLDDDGEIRIEPSYRLNIARRLSAGGAFGSIADFAGLDNAEFVRTRPLASYARTFAAMLYLHHSDKLRAFFDALADGEHGTTVDPTGVAALEHATGMDTAEFDAALAAWLAEQPDVPEDVAPGGASLGFEIANEPRGLVVTGFAPGRRGLGVQLGDTIIAIDGLPVRELPELLRVLGERSGGDTARLRVRTGSGTDRDIELRLAER